MNQMKKVCLIGSKRIPFDKSGKAYMGLSNKDLSVPVVKALVSDFGLNGKALGEFAFGAVNKHQADWNMAREICLDSGLSAETPAFDVQRACGTSLETILLLANKIAMGQIDVAIAGGSDTNSDVPMEFSKRFSDRLLKMNHAKTPMDKLMQLKGFSLKELMPKLPGIKEPRTGLSMGESCEVMAKRWKISRADQDTLASESHKKAAEAYEKGFYSDLLVQHPKANLQKDGLLRPDTTVEKLAKLKTVFDRGPEGTLTAGNSTALTDGAAAVLLCSEEYAKKMGWEIQAYFVDGQSAAVDFVAGEGLLMAPTRAVPKLLERNQLSFEQIDFFEIHEAFAAQVLATLKAWEDQSWCQEKMGIDALGNVPRHKMNQFGGSLALGHPFAATGARIVGTLSKALAMEPGQRGLISICTAGGMGVTAIIEGVNCHS